jgi:hypothetical protein
MNDPPTRRPRRPDRRGFTYFELQIAFAVLGITIAGLGPIVVSQLRLATRIERRVYCLVPREAVRTDLSGATTFTLPTDGLSSPERSWARRLGAVRVGMRLEVADISGDRLLGLDGPSGPLWLDASTLEFDDAELMSDLPSSAATVATTDPDAPQLIVSSPAANP